MEGKRSPDFHRMKTDTNKSSVGREPELPKAVVSPRFDSAALPSVEGVILLRPRNRVPAPVRSQVLSRGRRVSVVSFPGDSIPYAAYAVDVFGSKPLYLTHVKTVDGLRPAGFSGISLKRRRPLVIELPVPDFSAIRDIETGFRDFGRDLSAGLSGFRLGISPFKAAYVPLVGAMALGMTSALFLEHSFGTDARAEERSPYVATGRTHVGTVLGAETEKTVVGSTADIDTDEVLMRLSAEDPSKKELEKRIRDLVKGYPIEDMVPYIVEQDPSIAIYLVAIAKKESNWGKRVPVLNSQDCYNYWGYRGIRKLMGTGGHTCFNSRKDAVETVGKRLDTLINKNDLDTPQELVVWKCGYSCAGHDPYSVKKWISDVDLYYHKLTDPVAG